MFLFFGIVQSFIKLVGEDIMNSLNEINFESLGDNCEFAFYLRSKAVENGTLFRWALIRDYTCLLHLLKNNFQGFYEHDNLEPSWQDMVIDKSCKICFHTELYSHQEKDVWVFNESKEEREKIYKIEKQKIDYLVEKFKSSVLSGNTVFVIKNNNNDAERLIKDIASTIALHGKAKILYVKLSDNENTLGKVFHKGDNLYYGYIDRFADYHVADQFSVKGWDDVVRSFLSLV